ncbi:MAG: aminopeptidase P family protein [Elusimicrobiota bacterium]|jgi:Xaa-Pro aminopeptidase|nr:aminopeptidase P family protein [Elusimicrobiota bacterium]
MQKIDNSKIAALKNILKKNELDGCIITDVNDLKYFIGSVFLHNGEAVMLASSNGFFLTARSLYEAPVSAAFPQIKTEGCDGDRPAKIVETARKMGLGNIAFDGGKEIYSAGKIYEKAGFKDIPGIIGSLRIAKTEDELEIMRSSAGILYGAFKYIRQFLKPGVSESQIARLLEDYMLKKGASGPSFPTIVAFGEGTSSPHYKTGEVKLKKNMPVMLDFGCYYEGYCSDITRTFWYGDKPAPKEFAEILKTVCEAHALVAARAKYGMSGAEIDAIARGHIEAAGFGKYFTHRTGHGIGLEPHESGDISQLNKEKIGLNYCFSVEPGIYLSGKFGARWEDCFYMTKNGIKIIE